VREVRAPEGLLLEGHAARFHEERLEVASGLLAQDTEDFETRVVGVPKVPEF
jgi:hypothetical protein